MEILLNITWALCSLALVAFWMRRGASHTGSRKTQMLALGMVVLLLLPVISLSDDLIAMQGPAETDTNVRRALHPDNIHPSPAPVSLALPQEIVTSFSISGHSQYDLYAASIARPATLLIRSLESRPPPHV